MRNRDYTLPRHTNDSAIARARIDKGMTQGQLAEAVGCMQKDISRWERGVYSPRVDVLAKMAEVLGCSVDSLIGKGVQE